MIIKELTLKDFSCYYGDNSFHFEDGLNIILGHNGDGKSTIFMAFKWLFDVTYNINESAIISAKKISELSESESFESSVKLVVEQFDERITIEKRIDVTISEGSYKTSPTIESVYIENLKTGEAYNSTNVRQILDRIFPAEYRNFSMFETETETLGLTSENKLFQLINSFSDTKYLDNLSTKAKDIADKAEKAYRRHSNSSKKVDKEIKDLDLDIKRYKLEEKRLNRIINEDKEGLKKYQSEINELSRHSDLSEELNELDHKISDQKEKKKSIKNNIENKYTDYIFDDLYCLVGYEKYYDAFSDKVNKLRQQRNKEETTQLRKIIKEEEEQLLLENGVIPLPPGSPSEEILNEFLEDKTCKICGRGLDDEAKDYINKSIELFNKSKILTKNNLKESHDVFNNNFIDELNLNNEILKRDLRNQDIFSLKNNIEGHIDLNSRLNNDLDEINENILKLEKEREGILSQTNVNSEKLKNIIGQLPRTIKMQEQLVANISRNKTILESTLKKIDSKNTTKNKKLSQLAPSDFKFETIELLKDIEKIFNSTKNREYVKFLTILEDKATVFLKRMNPREVTGVIKLIKGSESVSIISQNEDGTLRYDTDNSGALQISIPMSILFAIAEIAGEIRDEDYPMIFDAPTGRFAPNRRDSFYNSIYDTSKQRIIVTLDYLLDKDHMPYVDKESFKNINKHKAFWILRERPFNESKRETINTNIIEL